MEHWRKNLYMAWLSQLLCILGFSSAFPFIPFYLQELGVVNPDQVKLWTGWISTGGSVTMAIFAPIWGALADRYGRKIMVERAAFGGAAIVTLMAFATSAPHLLVLRTLQGILTGTVAAFTTLVATTAPRERTGFSLGLMQMAVFSGSSGGPLLGGFIADTLGYRAAFIVCGIMLLSGGILAALFVQERFTPSPSRRAASGKASFVREARSLLSHPVITVMTVVIFSLQFTSSMVQPILPLFIQSLQASSERLATIAGLIQGATALSSALAAAVIGRVSDRFGHRRVLLLCCLGATAFYLPETFVSNSFQLLLLNLGAGVFLGGMLPTSNAFIALSVEEGKQGATYGLTASAGAAGRAVGPLIGSNVAVSLNMRALFPCAAIMYTFIAAWIALAVPKPTRVLTAAMDDTPAGKSV